MIVFASCHPGHLSGRSPIGPGGDGWREIRQSQADNTPASRKSEPGGSILADTELFSKGERNPFRTRSARKGFSPVRGPAPVIPVISIPI